MLWLYSIYHYLKINFIHCRYTVWTEMSLKRHQQFKKKIETISRINSRWYLTFCQISEKTQKLFVVPVLIPTIITHFHPRETGSGSESTVGSKFSVKLPLSLTYSILCVGLPCVSQGTLRQHPHPKSGQQHLHTRVRWLSLMFCPAS